MQRQGRAKVLWLIRSVHTVIFVLMAGSVFFILYCGSFGITGPLLFASLGLVAIEAVVFISNKRKCPLTALAQKYGADKGYVFDSFFPERLTRYTFPFFTSLLLSGLSMLVANRVGGSVVLRAAAGAGTGLAASYSFFFVPWHRRWGATDDEVEQSLPGDSAVPTPDLQTTRAITISARPSEVFPWLVQMGFRRGGLYSYDWLDRLFGFLDRPSETRIVPEFQDLKPGDVIPVGKSKGFPVTMLERNHVLVLSGAEDGTSWTWQMVLIPREGEGTRLLTRNRMRFPHTMRSWFFMYCLDLAAWIMVRKWLLNIKRRAEDSTRNVSEQVSLQRKKKLVGQGRVR